MERLELLEWAISGIENAIISIETQNGYDRRQLYLEDEGKISLDGEIKTKIRKRLADNLTTLDELKRKAHELKFERDFE